uniref:Uncharacterized protein n=1 Tax=Marseillevirus LCMAC103 TaxID=2506604 RepID=A0A481YU58_9VIRU|nr:MAG: hypothetical protein LCMAC103_00690 [Marseillevirus LCMAC103]
MSREAFRAFVVGSSVAATFVTVLYVGGAYRRAKRPSDFPFEWAALFIPVMYGLANVVNVRFGNTAASAAASGAALGLALSLVGRFGFDLPKRFFGFTKSNEWGVHFLAIALYTVIFVVLVRPINRVVLK